jgi:hypothetical protein
MSHLVLQFTHLENLLDEAAGTDRLRMHTLERTRKSSSSAITQLEVAIGVAVQAILPNGRILSWYHEIDAFCSFLPEAPAADSPGKLRYNAAWERALVLRDRLVACLRQQEHTVTTDGLVELNIANFLRGATDLVPLPAAPNDAPDGVP